MKNTKNLSKIKYQLERMPECDREAYIDFILSDDAKMDKIANAIMESIKIQGD